MITFDMLQHELNVYAAAVHYLDAAYAKGASYEAARVILVTQLRCTMGAATDLVNIYQEAGKKEFPK